MKWLEFQQVNGIWQFGKTWYTDIIGGVIALIVVGIAICLFAVAEAFRILGKMILGKDRR